LTTAKVKPPIGQEQLSLKLFTEDGRIRLREVLMEETFMDTPTCRASMAAACAILRDVPALVTYPADSISPFYHDVVVVVGHCRWRNSPSADDPFFACMSSIDPAFLAVVNQSIAVAFILLLYLLVRRFSRSRSWGSAGIQN
jgi:hypothetical protein